MVYIHRIWELGFPFVSWKVLLNNYEVGTLRNGGHLNFELENGDYRLQFIQSTLIGGEVLYDESFDFKIIDNQELKLNFKYNRHGEIEFVNRNEVFKTVTKGNKNKEQKTSYKASRTTSDPKMVSNHIYSDSYEIISVEEFPVDNSEGSDVIFIEHEFSKTVANEFNFENTNDLSMRLGIDFLKIFQLEISKNVGSKIGSIIGETISKKHTVSFNVKPGEKIKFIITWKRKNSAGECLVLLNNEKITIPYKIAYDLVYEIKTEKLKF